MNFGACPESDVFLPTKGMLEVNLFFYSIIGSLKDSNYALLEYFF